MSSSGRRFGILDVSASPVSTTNFGAFFTGFREEVKLRFIVNMHNLRFKGGGGVENLTFTHIMHKLRFICNLTCTTLGSNGVGGVEAKRRRGAEVSRRAIPRLFLLSCQGGYTPAVGLVK